MVSPVKIYQKEMHNNLGFFATWFPGDPIELGAVGTIQNGRFRQISSLTDFGIEMHESEESPPQPLKYTSTSGISIDIEGSAGSEKSPLSAEIKIDFSNEGAFLFEAMNVRQVQITNRFNVAEKIVQKYEEKKWDLDWYVVESLHLADAATIVVCQDQNAGIVLTANSNIPFSSTTLADPKLNLSVKSSRGRIFEILAGQNLRPLYSCLRLKDGIFTRPEVVPVLGGGKQEAILNMFNRPTIEELIVS